MPEPDRALVEAVRRGLAAVGDPAKAPGMRAYMKSAMPYRGVPAPAQRRLFRALFAEHPAADAGGWRATVLALWREASYREERYAAIALTGWRGGASWQTPAALPMYEEIVVDGAWWDYVDEVAIRRIGPLLRGYRKELTGVVLAWSSGGDRWLRRTSVICQVGAKTGTDLDLLAACIAANAADRDFFLRKAIGWALRDYARTDPDWVRSYVAAHAAALSPLSRREALKHVG